MDYGKFLKQKLISVQDSGFNTPEKQLNKNLFDFQKKIVNIALSKGRYAIFAECGLGKTIMQLEWAYQITKKTNQSILILCPLAVSEQTINEGKRFNIKVERLPRTEFLKELKKGIYISNYEQIENINASLFVGIVLDESSILKNFTGKIKQKIIETFQNHKYKLCCTATPSPNDVMELGNHSEFLNQMSRLEMLSMYFINDAGDTGTWKLKGHAKELFWSWVSEWSIAIEKPSDIGGNDNGFVLPKLNLIDKKIITKKTDNGELFNNQTVNAIDFNRELRRTKEQRLDLVAEIVNNTNDNFIVWIKQNEEGEYLKKLIKDCKEVKGSDNFEYKENTLLGFAKNEFRVLITKPKIAQFGLNYQNCHNQIFASLDFSYESLYQAIRRSYRFMQKEEVNIYLIVVDTMGNVINSIEEKQKQFNELREYLTKNINLNQTKKLMENYNGLIKETENYKMVLGDCVKEIKNLKNGSIDFSVFSPPFADLFVYSDKLEDMGNCKNYDEFAEHFKFLIPELKRVVKQGRLVAVHCKDLPIQKGKEGYIGLRDFSGLLIKDFQDIGFIYHSRITIWKDPVVEMQRTKALGLLHKQLKKDSSMVRVGNPDYVLIFRNGDGNEIPISQDMDVDTWQKWASPVWMDITQGDTLQKQSAREFKDEKHICPLQLGVIKRLLYLYSNEGETVLSPFAGIGSEGYESLKAKRKFIGIELKESYFNQAIKNLDSIEIFEKNQTKIF
jgi:DNA modification methylase